MEKKKQPVSNVEAILSHIENFGVHDKDSKPVVKKSSKSKIKRMPKNVFRHTLDLHGLTSQEAQRSVRLALDSCIQRGVQELLIIHGAGYHSNVNEGPILKGVVLSMLDADLHYKIRGYRPATLKDGGDGATLVYLV